MIKKALVVNDDDTCIFIACKMITKAQFAHETVTANNGEKALAYFENIVLSGKAHFDEVPEFIFLDLHMPVMNGWDFLKMFCEKYATIFPGTKVAVLSASMDTDDLASLQKYTIVSDFISTPISIEKLKQVKENFLGCQRIESLRESEALKIN